MSIHLTFNRFSLLPSDLQQHTLSFCDPEMIAPVSQFFYKKAELIYKNCDKNIQSRDFRVSWIADEFVWIKQSHPTPKKRIIALAQRAFKKLKEEADRCKIPIEVQPSRLAFRQIDQMIADMRLTRFFHRLSDSFSREYLIAPKKGLRRYLTALCESSDWQIQAQKYPSSLAKRLQKMFVLPLSEKAACFRAELRQQPLPDYLSTIRASNFEWLFRWGEPCLPQEIFLFPQCTFTLMTNKIFTRWFDGGHYQPIFDLIQTDIDRIPCIKQLFFLAMREGRARILKAILKSSRRSEIGVRRVFCKRVYLEFTFMRTDHDITAILADGRVIRDDDIRSDGEFE